MKQVLRTAQFRYFLCHLWFVPLSMSSAGCITAQQMRPVAQAGIEASVLAKQATASVRADLASYREAEFIVAALIPGTSVEDIEFTAKKTDELRDLLLARQAMFAELEKMYRTLKALADYDAAGAIDGVVEGAATAVLAYANLQRPASVPAPESVSSIIDTAATSIISGIQHRQLARANRGLAELNEEIVTQLKREKAHRSGVALVIKITKQNILIGLLKKRLAWPHSILADYSAAVGLVYDPKEFIRVYEELRNDKDDKDGARFKAMQAMLIRAHLAKMDRRLNIESDVLEESIKALQALAVAHRTLEADSEKLDLAELTAIVGQLRIVASEAATIAAEVRAARAAARAEALAAKEEKREVLTKIMLEAIAAHFGIELPATE